jgi:vitamin B12 transporter
MGDAMVALLRARWALVFVFGSISSSLAALALAADDAELDKIIVTATRTPEQISDVLASVTLLDHPTIEARQATSLQELLRGEAGIEISNDGGLGKVSSVFMRGTESDHVLILIDGIPLSSATVGSTPLQYLPVSEIDHIEIVRGPRSSLYGSDALGGVIQIFTRRGAGPFAPELALSNGSHALDQAVGSAQGSTEHTSYSVSGSYLTSNGYDSCLGAPYVSPSSPGGGCYTFVPYDDRFRNSSASGSITYRPSDEAEVEAFALRASGMTDFHSDYQNRENFVQQVAGIAAHWSPWQELRLTLRGGQARDEATDAAVGLAVVPQFPVPPGIFDTVRMTGTLQADWKPTPRDTLTVGADYLRDKIDSNTAYNVDARRDSGYFGQYETEFAAQRVLLSVRHDDNEQFGGKTTGGAAWGYRLADDVQFSASYATAFKAPTFNELYYPNYGTPTLQPETSHSVEIGADQRGAWGMWSLHAYETHIDDLIETNPNNFTAENIDKSVIKGVEAQIQRRLDAWTVGVTATWLDPRNRSGDANEGNLLPRRAQAIGRWELARTWARITATARLNIEGKRYDDAANTIRLGGYSTVDLLATWQITSALALQAKLANITDRRYETAYYYPQDGRNYLLTVRFAPLWPR